MCLPFPELKNVQVMGDLVGWQGRKQNYFRQRRSGDYQQALRNFSDQLIFHQEGEAFFHKYYLKASLSCYDRNIS